MWFDSGVLEGILGEGSGPWRAIRHPAYGPTRSGPQPNERLAESNVRFDARQDLDSLVPGGTDEEADWGEPEGYWFLGRWMGLGYDDSAWGEPSRGPEMGGAPFGPHEPRPIPQWRWERVVWSSVIDAPRPGFEVGPDGRVRWVSDGIPLETPIRNQQATVDFRVVVPEELEGETVDIRTDQYRGGGPPNVRGEYVLRAG